MSFLWIFAAATWIIYTKRFCVDITAYIAVQCMSHNGPLVIVTAEHFTVKGMFV